MNNPKKTNSIRLLNTYKFWGTMLLLFGTFCIPACKIYRFIWMPSVYPNWKTFSVASTINVATLQNPNAIPTFTDKLKESFTKHPPNSNSAIRGFEFSVTITEYNVEPVAITNTETTAQNRLNISVKVDCVNQRDK